MGTHKDSIYCVRNIKTEKIDMEMAELETNFMNKTIGLFTSMFEPSANETKVNQIKINSEPITEDPFFRDTFFHPSLIKDSEPCKAILHYHLGNTNLRVWDLIILLPNVVFLLFLFYKLPTTRLKLRATNSYLLSTLYFLVLTCSLVSALRCLLGMIIHLDNVSHDLANKGVWVTSRFILLSSELSVAVFGAAFGVRDTRHSVQTICLGCSLTSFVVCVIQAYLEIFQPFYGFQISTGFYLYGHGGPIYWAITSTLMSILYLLLLMTMICPSNFLPSLLPHSYYFFIYCGIQFILHSLTSIGAILLSINIHSGLCLTTITSFISFSMLSPLIFVCFLQNWFTATQSSLNFSYKVQLDDMEEDSYLPTSAVQSFKQEELEVPDMRDSLENSPLQGSI